MSCVHSTKNSSKTMDLLNKLIRPHLMSPIWPRLLTHRRDRRPLRPGRFWANQSSVSSEGTPDHWRHEALLALLHGCSFNGSLLMQLFWGATNKWLGKKIMQPSILDVVSCWSHIDFFWRFALMSCRSLPAPNWTAVKDQKRCQSCFSLENLVSWWPQCRFSLSWLVPYPILSENKDFKYSSA